MYVFDSNFLLIVALFEASLSAVLPLLPPPALLRTLLRHQHLLRIDGGDEVVGALLPFRREPGAKTIFPTKISKDISKNFLPDGLAPRSRVWVHVLGHRPFGRPAGEADAEEAVVLEAILAGPPPNISEKVKG